MAGGLGRLWSLAAQGAPNRQMLAALVMELGVTPALALWQGRVAASVDRAAANNHNRRA